MVFSGMKPISDNCKLIKFYEWFDGFCPALAEQFVAHLFDYPDKLRQFRRKNVN
jgi:hypothetical protein